VQDLPPHFHSSLKKLEFDKVIERVSKLAVTDLGRARVLNIIPSTDPSTIRKELQRVSEMKELLIAEGGIPIDGTKDIGASLRKVAVENQVLTVPELLEIGSTLRTSHTMHSFLAKRKAQYPSLSDFLETLFIDKVVEFNIGQALDEQGFVKDSASKELKRIRREMSAASEALRRRLERILRTVSEQDFLQEEILTTRDGRMVIPVKVEHKTHVAGFIHSSSASGQTVYIEPAEALDLNNELKELQLSEQREIYRILADLTKQVQEIREPLRASLQTLVEIDILASKGKYSIEIVGNAITLADTPGIVLVQARHPVLLQRHRREDVVPLSLKIGGDTSTLLITGPNAGGKTVTLKTVGLLTACTMAGLHVPAGSESEIYPFKHMFVDIGDDQSIESDLSTFSSHLINMKETIDEVDDQSLVLVDEIGAGTDPAEGAALAAAVLATLRQKKALTIATTHDGYLKAFAHESEGMENASMEFDQESLRPTYKLRIGIPGSSFAFELAERIGISNDVLKKARQHVGIEKTKLETLILDLERQRQLLATQLGAAKSEREQLSSLTEEYESRTKQLKKEIAELKRKAVSEARDLVRTAKASIERSVKEIRESNARPEIVRVARQNLHQMTEDLYRQDPNEAIEVRPTESFQIGDKVRLYDGTQVGEITQIQKDFATVAWGNANMRVRMRNLVKQEASQPTGYPIPRSDLPQIEAKNEIDLRGLYGDEAVSQVEQFIDNAFVSGLHRVDIIHGKGTGALRKRVTEFLKSCPHVKSFRLGEWNEGSTGVTVVEIS
jgi:DNA mismatch repair protein MutS2